jgi:hypothetical protein
MQCTADTPCSAPCVNTLPCRSALWFFLIDLFLAQLSCVGSCVWPASQPASEPAALCCCVCWCENAVVCGREILILDPECVTLTCGVLAAVGVLRPSSTTVSKQSCPAPVVGAVTRFLLSLDPDCADRPVGPFDAIVDSILLLCVGCCRGAATAHMQGRFAALCSCDGSFGVAVAIAPAVAVQRAAALRGTAPSHCIAWIQGGGLRRLLQIHAAGFTSWEAGLAFGAGCMCTY